MGYDEAIEYINLRNAAKACMKGNRWKNSTQEFELDLAQLVFHLHSELQAGTYQPMPTVNFNLCERGKWRFIQSHHIIDRTWYKSWCDHDFKPHIENRLLPTNSASQKGKGTDHSIKTFRRALAKAYRKWGKDFYVVTTDYHNYFGSLPHDKIIEEIRFNDPRSEKTLRDYINMFPGDRGVGIGGEPSQIIAIVYPSRVDRMIACNCPTLASGRYMDDSWFICHTKEEAQYSLKKFIEVSTELGLEINWNRTQIHHMKSQSVTWLKQRTSLTDTGKIVMKLTRKNVNQRLKAIDHYGLLFACGQMPLECLYMAMQCWTRYALCYNGYTQAKRVVYYFSQEFGVPDVLAKRLLHKNIKGWLNDCKNFDPKAIAHQDYLDIVPEDYMHKTYAEELTEYDAMLHYCDSVDDSDIFDAIGIDLPETTPEHKEKSSDAFLTSEDDI